MIHRTGVGALFVAISISACVTPQAAGGSSGYTALGLEDEAAAQARRDEDARQEAYRRTQHDAEVQAQWDDWARRERESNEQMQQFFEQQARDAQRANEQAQAEEQARLEQQRNEQLQQYIEQQQRDAQQALQTY